jgi:hypothetical protein
MKASLIAPANGIQNKAEIGSTLLKKGLQPCQLKLETLASTISRI